MLGSIRDGPSHISHVAYRLATRRGGCILGDSVLSEQFTPISPGSLPLDQDSMCKGFCLPLGPMHWEKVRKVHLGSV